MPIFINWFEVDVPSFGQTLPARNFTSWDESRAVHDQLNIGPAECSRISVRETTEIAGGDGHQTKTFLLGGFDVIPVGFSNEFVDLREQWQVCARVIEYNLQKHLAARSLHIHWSKTAISATKPEFVVAEIGLCVEAGVSFKSHYMRYHRKHGITLDWCVRQYFQVSLSHFGPNFQEALEGIPVLLTSEKNRVHTEIAKYCGHYVGIVTSINADDAVVLCRDGVKRNISCDLLFPEARGDVVARLAARMKTSESADSLVRRIQVLSYSLTRTNRRNLHIQQDRLRAAISFLNPDTRPALVVEMFPYCAGKMRVSSAPATARIEQTQYV